MITKSSIHALLFLQLLFSGAYNGPVPQKCCSAQYTLRGNILPLLLAGRAESD